MIWTEIGMLMHKTFSDFMILHMLLVNIDVQIYFTDLVIVCIQIRFIESIIIHFSRLGMKPFEVGKKVVEPPGRVERRLLFIVI